MIVRFKRLHADAKVPFRAHSSDSGADLYALEDMTLQMGETVVAPTGIALELPEGYEAQVRPRSGLSSKGISVGFGTVDNAFRGPVGVVLTNLGRTYKIHKGDRIAQLVIVPVLTPSFEEIEELSSTERGIGGFGSTGN